ncbi:hypothetical protein F5Y16DRAFT_235277 [Xylariaceae sp. FL0255]|nr:hypothetical protein F5Y16DRAFT_235277 [Xylariaceae sp. FL0255]
MPRFPVNFRRKSTANDDPNANPAAPSFRVLERPDAGNIKSFDGGVKMSRGAAAVANPHIHELASEDNLFAGLESNRGSGSSNTTKTHSDNSSRHSNASTAPSSAEYGTPQDEWRDPITRKPLPLTDNSSVPPLPPVPKSSGFLKNAGRTFSFGGSKKNHALPPIPAEEVAPPMPEITYNPGTPGGRSRATTASTISTATPPKLEDRDFMLDLGGDLSSVLGKFDKRSSVATLRERDLTGAKSKQPTPLHLDRKSQVEPPPKSWNSHNSNEGLLEPGRFTGSPVNSGGLATTPVNSKQGRVSSDDDEDSGLLNDSLAASRFLSSDASRQRKDDDRNFRTVLKETYESPHEGNLFDQSFGRPAKVVGSRMINRSQTAPQGGKVMTPKEFEKYRNDRANHERLGYADSDSSDKEDEDVNYEDDEDDLEKSKQVEKQRRKQEAQMSVYRQTMMKVTGESNNPPRPTVMASMSTPNLTMMSKTPPAPEESSEEDEEVPLAILAAHGFPNKNRPPTRLTNMPSQPNLRASVQQATARPGSVVGEAAASGAAGGRLPPFARKLPQDPYLGAGLVNQPPRESMAFGGGMAAQPRPSTSGGLAPGGLVGVIANEERARAMRRGSPAIDSSKSALPNMQMNPGFDPINGIPPQMMYPMGMQHPQGPMMTPADQAQMQMNQQMTQFMQMQMQFMQMMAQNSNPNQAQQQQQQFMGQLPNPSMGSFGGDMSHNSFMAADASRNSFAGGQMNNGMSLQLPQIPSQTRTMSMVQPSSVSWIQPPQPNFLPAGYTPSIAPSERSNVGLPGRYRPVSSMMGPDPFHRTSTMGTGSQQLQSKLHAESRLSKQTNKDDDDDDEEGWEAMKAKRDQKKSLWKSKKNFASEAIEAISFN